MFRRILIACLAAVALASCAQLQTAWSDLTTAQVTPSVVLVAGNTFDGLETIATHYLLLPKCNGGNPICRDPSATKVIVPAIRSGRAARNNLEQFFLDHPGQLGPQGLYDALQTSIATLQSVIAQYKIQG